MPTVSESVLSAWSTKEIDLISTNVQKKKIKKEKVIHVTIHMSKKLQKIMQEENFICYFLRSHVYLTFKDCKTNGVYVFFEVPFL